MIKAKQKMDETWKRKRGGRGSRRKRRRKKRISRRRGMSNRIGTG